MKINLPKLALALLLVIISSVTAFSQSKGNLKVTLKDSLNNEPVPYATVSLTRKGESHAAQYALTDENGEAKIQKVAAGEYTMKAEILGYKAVSRVITIKGNTDLGTIKMAEEKEVLDAASVTAEGNPVVVKEDTIIYNANSFTTTETDMLEDLLKKLPGVEVSSDGSITVNGKSVSRITIEGKTFFLNDKTIATKNLPAKMFDKVKVFNKKSDQAEFTGIDDGNEETVIDLKVKPGMMNGLIGNASAGGGHSLPDKGYYTDGNSWKDNDWRYSGRLFAGKFTKKTQIGLVINGNNVNESGFTDMSGGMMMRMRGGTGGGDNSGENRSFGAGLNGSWSLLEDKMQLSPSYMYNASKRTVERESLRTTYLPSGDTLDYANNGTNNRSTYGNRFGMRLIHKFSENTSIVFEPQINFGNGNFSDFSEQSTTRGSAAGASLSSNGFSGNSGDNKNFSTSGHLLLRQRLGIPGRTFTFNVRYSFSDNDTDGFNQSLTSDYTSGEQKDSLINQRYDQNQKQRSISGTLTYTEPLGHDFYVEANYSLGWNRSTSYKKTYDSGPLGTAFSRFSRGYNEAGEEFNPTYSNDIVNRYINQDIGANMLYQNKKLQAQIGFGIKPTNTENTTERNGETQHYDNKVVNWSPKARVRYRAGDNVLTISYNGQSSQPSTSQLMPVPNNANPMRVSFGNPYLEPSFDHSASVEYNFMNRKTFTSLMSNFRATVRKNPIINANWYGLNGAQYSIPVNGPGTMNLNGYITFNLPLAGFKFRISNSLNGGYSRSGSYISTSSFDTEKYYQDGEFDYELFHNDFPDLGKSEYFSSNTTQSMNFSERLNLSYRIERFEISAGGGTSARKAWYTVASARTNMTWTNHISGSVTWKSDFGMTVKSDFRYNWYDGYTTSQDPQYVWNATVSKTLFKNFTLSAMAYDILNDSRNLRITDSDNFHMESRSNTLGRYILFSISYRFGKFGRRGGGRPGGFGGPGPWGGPWRGPGGM